MKYFTHCENLEDLKAEYKRLAMENHPDRGGKTEIMQEVNNEYEIMFERLKNIHRSAKNETYTTQTESTETPQEFIEIINQLIRMNGIKIELIGRWIWVSGNTFLYKDTLKALNFKWAAQKKSWAWHKEEDRKLSHKTFEMDKIREMFGSKTFETETSVLLG